jgi:ADP-ribose pyrophosphatase
LSLESWKVLQSALVFSAPPWLRVYREIVELPGGRVLEDFYRVGLPEFVVMVPLTPAGELVMVRGYKHGLGRVSLTAPGGFINAGESPLEAAKRELLEETGYAAPEWHGLGHFVVDANRQCGVAHIHLARRASRVASPTQADPDEVVEVELIHPAQFLESVRKGDVSLLTTVGPVSLALWFNNQLDESG